MKKIILIVLSFLVIYYGVFNNKQPVFLFYVFLIFAILLYLLVIRERMSDINFASIRKVKTTGVISQIPIQLLTLAAIFWIELNTSDEILEIVFLVLKVVVLLEFLAVFLIELSTLGKLTDSET